MTKNEIIEAINATITPNGVKGITAESLANILTEIVNATPEGGGGSGNGALVVYDLAGATRADMEDSLGLSPEMDAVINQVFSLMDHNASIYAQLTTLMEEGKPAPLLMMDYGTVTNIMIPLYFQMTPDFANMIETYGMVASEPMMCLRYKVTGPITDQVTSVYGGNTDFFALIRPSEFDVSMLNDLVISSLDIKSGYFLAEDGTVNAITLPDE